MRNQKLLRIITLAVIVSLANICFAAAPTGILNSTNSRSVLVNGNLAEDGMTILSGSELRTDKGEASVNLGSLGQVDLGENTSAIVTYNDASVQLNVLKGEATLTTYKGVAGVLNTVDGKSLHTDATAASSTVDSTAMPATPAKKPWKDWTPGQKAGLVVGIAAAVGIAVVLVLGNRNDNKTVSGVR